MLITLFVYIAYLIRFGPINPIVALLLPVPVWRLLAKVTIITVKAVIYKAAVRGKMVDRGEVPAITVVTCYEEV